MAAWIPRKHHRRSIRLAGYDYAQPGAYFITICTQDRACLFGNVLDGTMVLNAHGRIVTEEWTKTGTMRYDIELDEWVVMPNHVHGVIWITRDRRGTARRAPTERFGGPVAGSLPTIIRSFKSAVTKRVNESRHTPGARLWQRNYYEHIIRNDESLNRIRQYINDNPAQWAFDRENPDAHAEADGSGRGTAQHGVGVSQRGRGTARRAPTRGPVIHGADRPAAHTETLPREGDA